MRVLWLALLLLASSVNSTAAEDLYSQIDTQQQQFDRLEAELLASQRRMLEVPTMSAAQELAYSQMTNAHSLLAEINRELAVLNKLNNMAMLVQGGRAIAQARKIIDQQKDYIRKRVASAAEFIEGMIPKARDSATSRLLLQARDSIKATADLLGPR